MIEARADKVIVEDLNHRKWIVYAKDGVITHRRKIYKNFSAAMAYASSLLSYYQIANLTEISR